MHVSLSVSHELNARNARSYFFRLPCRLVKRLIKCSEQQSTRKASNLILKKEKPGEKEIVISPVSTLAGKRKKEKKREKKRKDLHSIIQIYFLSEYDRSIALDIAVHIHNFGTIHTVLFNRKEEKIKKRKTKEKSWEKSAASVARRLALPIFRYRHVSAYKPFAGYNGQQ